MEKLKKGTIFTIGETALKRRILEQKVSDPEKIFIEVQYGPEWISGYISLTTYSMLHRSGKIHIVSD